MQEVVARAGHIEAAVGFALACAAHLRRATDGARLSGTRLSVWVRQDAAIREAGDVYGPALSAFSGGAPVGRVATGFETTDLVSAGSAPSGSMPTHFVSQSPSSQSLAPESGLPAGLLSAGLLPEHLVIVRARTFINALQAGLEAVRCAALDVVFIETVAAIDLTASRRLKLAVQKSGVAAILLRHAATPVSNAVSVRWQVGAAARCENDKKENEPEVPRARFDVELMKHPAGLAGARWRVEWNDERQQFACDEALPQPVDAIPAGRPLASPDGKTRRSA